MSARPPSQPRRGYDNRPAFSDYEPEPQGYSVPYAAPQGISRRIQQYQDLRKQSQASSMAWWGTKALQGCLLGLLPVSFGLLLSFAYVLIGGPIGGAFLGVILLVGGLLVFLRYALAPWTANWIVDVTDKGFWVVEDDKGAVAEYLPEGRMIVPFRMNFKVHRYVTFRTIRVSELYDNVMPDSGQNISMEIRVSLVFDPVSADPHLYKTLRDMTRPEQFEKEALRQVHLAVKQYFTRLAPRFWTNALQNPKVIELAIIDKLIELESMGLFLGPLQPVNILVRGMPITSGSLPPPPAPEFSMRDPLDLTPPPEPSSQRTAAGQFVSSIQPVPPVQPTSQHYPTPPPEATVPIQTRDYEFTRPHQGQNGPDVDWEPPADNQATLPHVLNEDRAEQSSSETIKPFIQGSVDFDIGDDHTDVDTLLQQDKARKQPPTEAASKSESESDHEKTQPKTAPPDFWIKRPDGE